LALFQHFGILKRQLLTSLLARTCKMGLSSFYAVALLCVGASAFRVKPKKRMQVRSQPAISGIFAFAAPGSAQPGLQNPRGGCFPGYRSAAVKKQWFGQEADTATTITGVIGFRHPFMDFKLLDLKDPQGKNKLYRCDSEVANRPRGLSKFALHAKDGYRDATENLDLGWGRLNFAMARMGNIESYNMDRNSAHSNAQSFGWNLIGSATDDGGGLYVGKQVSHLFQKASSGECTLTFQGSSSFSDWTANFNIQKKPFCGYAPATAFIAANDTTSVLGAGQSLVHKGFQDALMAIVRNKDWQSDIRPKLSGCTKVYVTGHSLGAAQAELFGACINSAPGPGQDGHEHYKYMSYTR